MAKEYQQIGINIIPGKKMCTNCRTVCDAQVKSSTTSLASPLKLGACEEDLPKVVNRSEAHTCLNESLTQLGCSPIKLHSLPAHSRKSYMKRKMSQLQGTTKIKMAYALGLNESQFNDSSDNEVKSKELMKKANDMDDIIRSIQQKLPIVNNRQKIQLLTIIPESWSRDKVATTFGVSEYMRHTNSVRKKVYVLYQSHTEARI